MSTETANTTTDAANWEQKRSHRLEGEEALARQNDAMAEKLRKTADWLDRLAASAEESAKTCRFGSLVAAYQGDARNYRATAAEIRSVLTEPGAQG